MKLRLICLGVVSFGIFAAFAVRAQEPQSPNRPTSNPPTIKVTSTLVFVDVTVLDKKGHPVISGLTKGDFTITEDKTPQTIFSFEPPEVHAPNAATDGENPGGKAPATILVLDQLNSRFEDFAYIRYEVQQFLKGQPARLSSPTELLIVGNKSLEMLQSYTRSKAELLDALGHALTALPYKEMSSSFASERFVQSLAALDEIALQNRGVPGRKNIIWMGRGGPSLLLDPIALSEKAIDALKSYEHSTTNMLVDARISLFVIFPGLRVEPAVVAPITAMQGLIDIGDDPFVGDINFGVFANETGGKVFYNRNDLKGAIVESKEWGSRFYTLTYQPTSVGKDGKFRRIRVTLGNPSLRVVTKAGYYAPDANAPIDPQHQKMLRLAEAIQSTIPFDALSLSLSGVERHPDSRSAEFTVALKSTNLTFQPWEQGTSVAQLIVAAASLDQFGNILASRTQGVTLLSHSLNPVNLPEVVSRFPLTVPVPRKTRRVRVTIQLDDDGGRIGSAELDRQSIDAAPESETPRPQLQQRPMTGENSLLHP
jgi:VWFA-related protein